MRSEQPTIDLKLDHVVRLLVSYFCPPLSWSSEHQRSPVIEPYMNKGLARAVPALVGGENPRQNGWPLPGWDESASGWF